MEKSINTAVNLIKNSSHTTAFTGAGISVESGIPPFRGHGGLYNKYDPKYLDISYFYSNPKQSWGVIKEIFYDFLGEIKPNAAHYGLARLEEMGLLKAVITQNIDNLHQEAGSQTVYEYHGNARKLICTQCGKIFGKGELSLEILPVLCPDCHGLVKPDFIFFGEGIPEFAVKKSDEEACRAEVFIVIGSAGEVMPACLLPVRAREKGAKIIEINVEPSNFTQSISDVFIQGKATEMMTAILQKI